MVVGVDSLASHVRDGDLVALPSAFTGSFSGACMTVTRELIQRGVRNLHLLGVPALGYQADLLIGAGCVSIVEAGSILLYEYGPARRFVAAQRDGAIEVRDTTCPAIQAGLVAAEKGLPFLPVRGILGSDLLRHRQRLGDWRVASNPFAEHDDIVVVKAIQPDIALFHAPLADARGNVWIGARAELNTMARASRKALVTFETLYDGNLLDDDRMAAATIPAAFITAVSHQPKGALPLDGGDAYGEDETHLREYARLSQTPDGFAQYLASHVMNTTAAA
jgi:glutaconate CoA-transferase subunit A